MRFSAPIAVLWLALAVIGVHATEFVAPPFAADHVHDHAAALSAAPSTLLVNGQYADGQLGVGRMYTSAEARAFYDTLYGGDAAGAAAVESEHFVQAAMPHPLLGAPTPFSDVFVADYAADGSTSFAAASTDTVTRVVAGAEQVFALLESGGAMVFGSNEHHAAGTGGATSERITTPTPIHVLTANHTVLDIAAGGRHSVLVATDIATGEEHIWGTGVDTELQLGTSTPASAGGTYAGWTPLHGHLTQFTSVTRLVDVAAGNYHTLWLRSDGIVFASGRGGDGQLGDGTFVDSAPMRTTTLTALNAQGDPVVEVHAGGDHSALLTQASQLWLFGNNDDGQLCTGDTVDTATPQQVILPGSPTIHSVALSDALTLILTTDGVVYACGAGQGLGAVSPSTVPQQLTTWRDALASQVTPLPSVVALASNRILTGTSPSVAAIDAQQRVWMWGNKERAQLPLRGGGTSRPFPTLATDYTDRRVASVAFSLHACFALTGCLEGDACARECTGGCGAHGTCNTFVGRCECDAGWCGAQCGSTNGCVFAAGNNEAGQLGMGAPSLWSLYQGFNMAPDCEAGDCNALGKKRRDAQTSHHHHHHVAREALDEYHPPTALPTTSLASLATRAMAAAHLSVKQMCVGHEHVLVLTHDDELYGWGGNYHYQLGVTHNANLYTPTLLNPSALLNDDSFADDPPAHIACGAYHSMVLSRSGRLAGAGRVSSGQLCKESALASEITWAWIDVPDDANMTLAGGDSFVGVRARGDTTVLLTSAGRAFVCGVDQHGHHGIGGAHGDVHYGEPMDYLYDALQERIDDVRLGASHTAIHTTHRTTGARNWYTAGAGGAGQLGRWNYESTPWPLPMLFGSDARMVQPCATAGTLVLDAAGALYALGDDALGGGTGFSYLDAGVFSDTPDQQRLYPRPLLLERSNIEQIECGADMGVARTGDGAVFAWGANLYGELGRRPSNKSDEGVGVLKKRATMASAETVLFAGAGETVPGRVMDLPGISDVAIGDGHFAVFLSHAPTATAPECPHGLCGSTCDTPCVCAHGALDPITNTCTCDTAFTGVNCTLSAGATFAFGRNGAHVGTDVSVDNVWEEAEWFGEPIVLGVAAPFLPTRDVTAPTAAVLSDAIGNATRTTLWQRHEIMAAYLSEPAPAPHAHMQASLVVDAQNNIYTQGFNGFGALGNGFFSAAQARSSHVLSLAPGTMLNDAAITPYNTLLALSSGQVLVSGRTDEGVFGDAALPRLGAYNVTAAPDWTAIPALDGTAVVSIDAKQRAAAAVHADGHAWVWGAAMAALPHYQTECPEATPAGVPCELEHPMTPHAPTFAGVHLAHPTTATALFAWDTLGAVYVLGDASFTHDCIDGAVDGAAWTAVDTGGLSIVDVRSGAEHTVLLASDGTLLVCGANTRGELGGGQLSSYVADTPESVPFFDGSDAVVHIAVSATEHFTAVATAAGRLYTWGAHTAAASATTPLLGNDALTADVATPMHLGRLTNVMYVASAGASTVAITSGCEVGFKGDQCNLSVLDVSFALTPPTQYVHEAFDVAITITNTADAIATTNVVVSLDLQDFDTPDTECTPSPTTSVTECLIGTMAAGETRVFTLNQVRSRPHVWMGEHDMIVTAHMEAWTSEEVATYGTYVRPVELLQRTPSIAVINTRVGDAAGGTELVVTGDFFYALITVPLTHSVTVDDQPCIDVQVASLGGDAGTITCTTTNPEARSGYARAVEVIVNGKATPPNTLWSWMQASTVSLATPAYAKLDDTNDLVVDVLASPLGPDGIGMGYVVSLGPVPCDLVFKHIGEDRLTCTVFGSSFAKNLVHSPSGGMHLNVHTVGGTGTWDSADNAVWSWLQTPTIEHVAPDYARRTASTRVTLTGIDFGPADAALVRAVELDGVPCTDVQVHTPHTQWSCTSGLKEEGDSALFARAVDVHLEHYNATTEGLWNWIDPPTVLSVSPQFGDTAGGDTITVVTSHLYTPSEGTPPARSVWVDGQPCTGLTVEYNTPNDTTPAVDTLRCVVTNAANRDGARKTVRVKLDDGELASSADNTLWNWMSAPIIERIEPPFMAHTGNREVTVYGLNFGPDDDALSYVVTVGGVACSNAAKRAGEQALTCMLGSRTLPGATHLAGQDVRVVVSDTWTSVPNALFTWLAPPELDAALPTLGRDGIVVELFGSELGPPDEDAVDTLGVRVYLDGVECVEPTIGWDNITCTLPEGVGAGRTGADKTVRYELDGMVAELEDEWTWLEDPVITAIEPRWANVAGGTRITITAEHLYEDYAEADDFHMVELDGTPCTVELVSNGTLVCAVTEYADSVGGLRNVTLSTGTWQEAVDTLAVDAWSWLTRPQVTRIEPDSGSVHGGTHVTIHGAHFGPTSDAFPREVTVDDIPCSVTAYAAYGTIECTVGASGGKRGVDKRVKVDFAGLGLTSQFNTLWAWLEDPSITSVVPLAGAAGGNTRVTVSGTNFGVRGDSPPLRSVSVDGQPCAVESVTAGAATGSAVLVCVTSNPGDRTGADKDIVVFIDGTPTAAFGGWQWLAAPTVSRVLPQAGQLAGGSLITVFGDNFGPDTNGPSLRVLVGGEDATDVQKRTGEDVITCRTPAGGRRTRAVTSVQVIVDGVEPPAPVAFEFLAPPEVFDVEPVEGMVSGGTVVTLTGSAFGPTEDAPARVITLGGVACDDVARGADTAQGDHTLTCTTGETTADVVGEGGAIVLTIDGVAVTAAQTWEWLEVPEPGSGRPTGDTTGWISIGVTGAVVLGIFASLLFVRRRIALRKKRTYSMYRGQGIEEQAAKVERELEMQKMHGWKPLFAEGDLCLALYEVDGEYYDAKVLGVEYAKRAYHIVFTEYDEEATVAYTKVLPAP